VVIGHSSSMCLTDKIFLQMHVTFCEYSVFHEFKPNLYTTLAKYLEQESIADLLISICQRNRICFSICEDSCNLDLQYALVLLVVFPYKMSQTAVLCMSPFGCQSSGTV